jgi:hypothetical protein
MFCRIVSVHLKTYCDCGPLFELIGCINVDPAVVTAKRLSGPHVGKSVCPHEALRSIDPRIGMRRKLRRPPLGGRGSNHRRNSACTYSAAARFHLCVAPPRIHAAHYRHRILRFGRNSAGGLRSCWRWWRHSCSNDSFRMALHALWARRILGDGSAVHYGLPVIWTLHRAVSAPA